MAAMFLDAFSKMKIFAFWLNMSLKIIPTGSIDNKAALVEIMARRRIGDKPLS